MKSFPQNLEVKNKENFSEIRYERMKCYLRRDVYDHMISYTEEDFFDVDKFDKDRIGNMKVTNRLIADIREELEKLGWKSDVTYGGTGLFIYANTRPRKCLPE